MISGCSQSQLAFYGDVTAAAGAAEGRLAPYCDRRNGRSQMLAIAAVDRSVIFYSSRVGNRRESPGRIVCLSHELHSVMMCT